MNPTPAGQSDAVGTKSAPPGLTKDIRSPQKGPFGAQTNPFCLFLEVDGSIWAITVLEEPGIPLRRSGHPTSLSLTPSDHMRAVGTKSGPLGPSEDLGGPQKGLSGSKRALPPVARKGPDIRSKFVLTMNLTQAGQWGAVGTKSGPRGPSEGLGGPQKGIWGPKQALLGPPGAQKGA